MSTALTILAFIAGVAGFFCLSQATMGIGIICLGCLAGIIARVLQADEQHAELLKTLGKRGTAPEAEATAAEQIRG